MTRDNGISRRTAMKLTGAAAATAVVAGCSDDNGDDDENGENGEDGGDGFEIEAGETIELDAQSGGWEGVAPSDIDGETNPTLILEEGEEYEIGWEEGDGQNHNIEIRDEDGDVVDDYETDEADEGGDDQFIEFEASEDTVEYVCAPHESAMAGEIELGEGDGNGDDENGDDEENGADDENGDDENGADDENGEDDENGADENGEDDENGADDENGDDENGEDDDTLVGDDDE